jgi:ATP-dependent protease Clp ATPase subunit
MNEELENFSKKKCSFCKQTSYKISKILENYGLIICEKCIETNQNRIDYMRFLGLKNKNNYE